MKAGVAQGTIIGIAIGVAAGIGGYTFLYAKGASYLTNDPKACINCHVMQDYYDAWIKSSHRSVAVCNDCHAPHNFIGKYATKAENGFWHSFAFTTGRFKDNIQIKERNLKVTEKACLGCHDEVVASIATKAAPMGGRASPQAPSPSPLTHGDKKTISCIRCHGSVGHPL